MLKYFYDSNGDIRFLLSKSGNFKNQDAYNLYYYVKDELGNITGLIRVKSQSGSSTVQDKTLVAQYTYDPYGKIESATRPSGITDDIYQINPIRYKGYYYDSDSGWYNLKTRYYDPVIARFINADDTDTLLDYVEDSVQESNLYTYCLNNPIMYYDSDGRFAQTARLAGGNAYSWDPVNGIVIVATTVVVSVGYSIYKYSEHTKNKRKSTYDKHTKPRPGRSHER